VTEERFGYWLRPQQADILAYESGKLAVLAAPGSGKTLTLSLLAAKLILENRLPPDSEVLIVTFLNSAVENIAGRIRKILSKNGMPPVGFRVCTLHKLASDIIRERLDLAGIDEDLVIVDDSESERLMRSAVQSWKQAHESRWLSFIPEAEKRTQKVLSDWQDLTQRIGKETTRFCKHARMTPEQAKRLLNEGARGYDLAQVALELYEIYTRYLSMRGGLDFNDLIWRAIDALDQDPTFLTSLRRRWPYILEDEAQDSMPLQQEILERLCGPDGNWVRVGDPNQAINSTFTAADPIYFRRFAQRPDVTRKHLLVSGRCARPIIAMANRLIAWACHEHPEPGVRELAFELQEIQPTELKDPQPNPPDDACKVYFRHRPFPNFEKEASWVVDCVVDYLRRHPEDTVAILCPTHFQGAKVVEALQHSEQKVPYRDLLRSTPQIRNAAGLFAAVCAFMASPMQATQMANLYEALAKAQLLPVGGPEAIRRQTVLVRSIMRTGEFLFPRETFEVTDVLPTGVPLESTDLPALHQFRALVGKWAQASHLPIDQFLLTVAQDLFKSSAELALCHTIALSLRSMQQMNPQWGLGDFALELRSVAENSRALQGLSLVDQGYAPERGTVIITTMHKAKGLEWDAVYLLCVNNLEFPEGLSDRFRSEPYFMPGRAPTIEAREHLARQLAEKTYSITLSPIEKGRLEFIAERLRLLYVCVTRARRNLSITWSKTSKQVRQPLAVRIMERAYQDYRKGKGHGESHPAWTSL